MIDASILMSGLHLSEVPSSVPSDLATWSPHLVIVADGSPTFDQLSHHQYKDGRSTDPQFDQIGKGISVSIEQPVGNVLSAVSNVRIRSHLSRANASLVLPYSALSADPILRATAAGLKGTGKFIYMYGPGITLAEAGKLLGVDLGEGDAFNYSVVGVAVTSEGIHTRRTITSTGDSDSLKEEALRWIVTWELDRMGPPHGKRMARSI
ncbi:MAG: hypothetical protein ACM3XM_03710 [Mycobacterium leprae]